MNRGRVDKLVQTDEASFDQILNDIGDRLKKGESVDVEEYASRSPSFADRLRKAIPGIRALVRLGHNDAIASSPDDPHPALGELGDFRILHEIGRGGMGVVYEAEQISIGRSVALKVLPFAGILDERQLARFKNESRAAGSLDHSNIVHVYQVGSERGVHYYAMQLVKGQSLAEMIADLRGDGEDVSPAVPADVETKPVAALSTERETDSSAFFRRIVRLGIQAAEALDHAHGVGIVHRDIKPSNLMVDMAGKLLITDFGLAQIQGEGNLTMTGDLVGTLRYMSPEQAAGDRAVLDHRADIYSLGITLYELLTLRPAFEGTDKAKLLRDILEHEPPAPRSINSAIPRDLETIVLKAISKDPADRYASATELAADLRRFVDDTPIRAKRISLAERSFRWVRRRSAAVSAVAALLLVSSIVAIIGAARFSQQRNDLAESLLELRTSLYRTDTSSGFKEYSEGNLASVKERLARHEPGSGQKDLRGFEHGLLSSWVERIEHVPTVMLCSAVTSLALSPENTTIAAACQDGQVRIVDVASHQISRLLDVGEDTSVVAVVFSPNSRYLATAGKLPGEDGASIGFVAILEWPSGKIIHRFIQGSHSRCIAFSADGSMLASGDRDGKVRLWQVDTGKTVTELSGHKKAVFSVAFSPDGRLVASAGRDKTVRISDLEDSRKNRTLETDAWRLDCVTFSRDGKTLVASGWKTPIRLWNVETGRTLIQLGDSDQFTSVIAFLGDRQTIVTGNGKNLLDFWDTHTGKLLKSLPAHQADIISLVVSTDGQLLVTGSRDGTIKIWVVQELLEQDHFQYHEGKVNDVVFSADSRWLATAANDHTVGIVDAITGKLMLRLEGHSEIVESVAFSPKSELLNGWEIFTLLSVSGFYSHKVGEVIAWRIAISPGGIEKVGQKRIANFDQGMRYVAISPDGNLAAAGRCNGAVTLWDLQTWSEVATLASPGSDLWQVEFSADGKTLAAVGGAFSDSGYIRAWNVENARDGQTSLPVVFNEHDPQAGFPAMAFSRLPGSNLLAVTSVRDTISIWNVNTKLLVQEFASGLRPMGVTFSPDGTRLATCAVDGFVRIWDASTGSELARFPCDGSAAHVRFSPDGNKLAVGDGQGRVWIWNAEVVDRN